MAMPDLQNVDSWIDWVIEENKSYADVHKYLRENGTNKSLNNIIYEEKLVGRGLVLIVAYGILVMVALFGNVLVCHVIFSRRRMRTVTNIFIANLAVSDILLIVLNVPFNIAKTLMKEWLFGNVMCHVMNMSLIASVYASTFTLTVIALDRQRVLLYPLRPRILKSGGMIVVAVIWIVSIILALPFGIYSETKEVNIYVETMLRCRSVYPSETFEQYLSVLTIIIQYILPLSVIAVTYGRIVRRIWERSDLGAVTEYQHARRSKHKKKSIKMLMIVVIVFAICWMPLNLYHILTDLHPDSETFHYNATAFFVCHWVAISSTCYNPFIYCWLNEAFRSEIRAVFKCCCSSNRAMLQSRENKMAESTSQSEFVITHTKPKSILYRRGRSNHESVKATECSDSASKLRNYNIDRASTPCGCENVCLCLTPDSWKSVSGVTIDEREDLLNKNAEGNKHETTVHDEDDGFV